jgi:hypothetical protein
LSKRLFVISDGATFSIRTFILDAEVRPVMYYVHGTTPLSLQAHIRSQSNSARPIPFLQMFKMCYEDKKDWHVVLNSTINRIRKYQLFAPVYVPTNTTITNAVSRTNSRTHNVAVINDDETKSTTFHATASNSPPAKRVKLNPPDVIVFNQLSLQYKEHDTFESKTDNTLYVVISIK